MQQKKQHWYKNLQQTNTPLSGDALFCNEWSLVELSSSILSIYASPSTSSNYNE